MTMRTLLATFSMSFLVLYGVSTAQAQCQNQGCQRPFAGGNPNCYTCSDVTGVSCSLSGTCPQSCTETTCQTGGVDPCEANPSALGCPGNPCTSNPTAAGCPNQCATNPNATQCCGTDVVCTGNPPDPSGPNNPGGPPTGGNCITGDCSSLIPRSRSLWKDIPVMTAQNQPKGGLCQSLNLPKKLLFSL